MNKQELIEQVAKVTGMPKSEVNQTVDALNETITKALKKGEKVALAGFGIYSVAKRKARIGINPRTKQKIKIAAKKVPVFRAAKALKKKVK